jgi:multiple sugar transport system permease protein
MPDTQTKLRTGEPSARPAPSTRPASGSRLLGQGSLMGPTALMILPGLLLTAVIIGYPVIDLAWTSLHRVTRFGTILPGAGLVNYRDLIADPFFLASLWRTIIWTVAVVGGTLILSVPIALILNDDFFGRGIARTIVMLPWSVSLTMTAVVWRWALNGRAGLLNASLMQLDILQEPIEWLGEAHLAFLVEIIVGILVSIPFTTTVLLGGLSSAPRDVYEAGAIDGATSWQLFRHLTWPLLKPFLNIAIVLNIIYVFNSFPIIWVMTEGGPANETDILVTYLYKLAFRFGQLGKASAISLVMLVILLVFTVLYTRMQVRSGRGAAAEKDRADVPET